MPRGVTLHRQSQQFTLATLMDFHEANPIEQYTVVVHQNRIRTLIGAPDSSSYIYEQDVSNRASEEGSYSVNGKKNGGLFGNLIKNMKNNHVAPAEPLVQQNPPIPLIQNNTAKRPYTFFYPNLERKANEVSPMRQAASAKKVKERATGVVDMKIFRNQDKQVNENANNLNNQQSAQLPLTFRNKDDKQSPARGPFGEIAIDFSFEEKESIIKQITAQKPEIKITDHQKIQEDKLQDNFILKVQSNVKKTEAKHEESMRIVVHQQKQKVTKRVLSPIHPKGIHEFKDSRYVLSLNSREDISVQGAKKAESYFLDHQKQEDPREVRIDFDLDLNFI